MTDKMIAVPRELLEALDEILDRADTSEGYCCCGDSMDNHASPMTCGHSPVDAGDYYADPRRDELKALLREAAQPEQDGTCPDCNGVGLTGGQQSFHAPDCQTCNGTGLIGGPSFYAPDEGGEPCPDCTHPTPDDEELRRDAERYRWLRRALSDRANGKSHWFCLIPDGCPEELDAPIDAALAAARGLRHGTDWDNGTHAKLHGYRQKLLTALDERDALLREALLREAAQPEQITPKQLARLVSDNPDVQFSVKPIPKPTGDWRASASEWLKLMADEQESLSACYPGHAAAYDWWVQKPQMLRVLAEQVLTSKLNASPADEELRRDAEQTAAARDVLAERQRL